MKTSQIGIGFEILQRCQRPEYSTHLTLFHQYRAWKDQRRSVVVPDQSNKARSHSTRESGADIELQAKAFIETVKQMGKGWDVVMLLVAIYHLVVTPFKVCFSHDLSKRSSGLLRGWSGFEIFLDLLCVFDVAYKIRNSSTAHEGGITTTTNTRRRGFRDALSNPALRTDIFAMLPLELLLLSGNVRVPLPYASSHEETEISWWTTRWLLRMNRMLLSGWIEPLSEQLFQFIIYDRKMQVNEAFLYFVRGLLSWLTMGHLLACIWFLTSDLGFYHYGTSWLSTSGMLTFIGEIPEVEEHERRLSEVFLGFSLEGVYLYRKYLRSLLFSLECISTLFSGDILSMNPAELLAEIVITLWSIYIYGALVGAQGELLDARAKREAAFEQTLGELQHYLVQNEVPKGIKRQVKAYYARLWRRRKGEAEFAAVDKVSRALYEDVVLSTVRSFAVQVTAFQALDEQFLRALLVCLEYVVCSENEEVFVVGDMDRNMYLIAHGRVSVRLGSCESIRERGEFFGELALLYGIPRLETCVALSVAELYRLDHEPYEKLLREFPEYRARNKLAWTT
eukprot:jgi/Phyca11/101894/e_gw1.6.767.1